MSKKKIQSLHHWQRQDPYYQREIEKYGENPLPSREFIMQCLEKEGRLLSFAEIINIFQLDEARAELFSHRLKAMIRAGQLMSNRQGQIGLSRKMDLVAGRVIAHPEGYGFLHFEGDEPDGFIPPKYMNELMHDDKILARVSDIDRQGRKDYAPVEILERGQARIVGKLSHLQGLWFVLPENRRLNRQFFIPDDKRNGAKNGEIVVAEIVEYPTRHSQAVAKILYVLGEERAAGMEVEIALENHNIPREFPEAVQQETAAVPEALRAQDYENRLDLRHLPFVTIDDIKLWSVISQSAVIMDSVSVEEDCAISPFVTLGLNVQIGKSFHANLYSYVEHDCVIGDYVTFAPSVKCNGNVHIGNHTYVGAGAMIKQGTPDKPLKIGKNVVIGMGAVVINDIPDDVTVVGNPARILKK